MAGVSREPPLVVKAEHLASRQYLGVKPRQPGKPTWDYCFPGGCLLRWEAPLPGVVNEAGQDIGYPLTYRVHVATAGLGAVLRKWREWSADVRTTQFMCMDLERGKRVRVRVQAYTPAGDGPWSAVSDPIPIPKTEAEAKLEMLEREEAAEAGSTTERRHDKRPSMEAVLKRAGSSLGAWFWGEAKAPAADAEAEEDQGATAAQPVPPPRRVAATTRAGARAGDGAGSGGEGTDGERVGVCVGARPAPVTPRAPLMGAGNPFSDDSDDSDSEDDGDRGAGGSMGRGDRGMGVPRIGARSDRDIKTATGAGVGVTDAGAPQMFSAAHAPAAAGFVSLGELPPATAAPGDGDDDTGAVAIMDGLQVAVRREAAGRKDVERQLARMRGDAAAIDDMSIIELKILETRLQEALARVQAKREALQKLEAAEADMDQNLCVICQDGRKTILLLPCRHLALCALCNAEASVTECPLCRTTIEQSMQVFT